MGRIQLGVTLSQVMRRVYPAMMAHLQYDNLIVSFMLLRFSECENRSILLLAKQLGVGKCRAVRRHVESAEAQRPPLRGSNTFCTPAVGKLTQNPNPKSVFVEPPI